MEQATATQHGGAPNPVDTTGLCLLSLDGGGVRGLSTLYILKSIMDRLNHDRNAANLPTVKPCEVFDLIGGTSTGGLIAIMLGRLEMDVDECIRAYSDLAETVFGNKAAWFPCNFKGKIIARCDSAKLKAAILKVIKQSGASGDELLNDRTERGCKTFVCTADRYTKNIIRLRDYSLPHEPDIPATILQAALATSAATTFFEHVIIESRSFADGGFGANNPVDEVEGEASNIWCTETGDLKPLVKCFISIGTGNPGHQPFENGIGGFLSETMVQIATETENTENKFIARWAKHFDEKRYFRFNVEQGLQNIGLDEYKKKGDMLAATEAYITHKERFFKVRDCMKNLRLKQNKTEKSFVALVQEYEARICRQQPTHRASWIVPFERNPRFTGRQSQLSQLDGKLFAGDSTTKIAVIGLGGVGKSQLVLEFLFRTKDKYPDSSIIWIPAYSLESLHQAYLDVAQRLQIPGSEDDTIDAKKLVQDHLSSESAGRWVLVFDNADDIDMWIGKANGIGSRAMVDSLPKNNQGAILFTTRDRKLAIKLAHQNVIETLAMEKDVATELLEKYLVDPLPVDSRQATVELLSKLTYLPLAIVQAAAYINENTATIEEYLLLLAEQEEDVIELLSEDFEDDGRYRDTKNPVATTWLVSFEQIRRRDPLAANYLSFMACVEPKDIPMSLLPQEPQVSRKKRTDAIGTLTAYSFINKHSRGEAIDLHRLVHLATRNWLLKEEQLKERTMETIEQIEKGFPDHKHENRNRWRSYLPHVKCVLKAGVVDEDREERMNLMWRYGMCLEQDGRWVEAVVPITQVVDIKKRKYGLENPDTLAGISQLGWVLERQGKFIDAEAAQRQAWEGMKKVLGPEHPDTLGALHNLGLSLEGQGKFNDAEPLLRQVLEGREKMLSPDHADVLACVSNLGFLLWRQGKYEEAEKMHRRALKGGEDTLGAEHPDTLTSLDHVGLALRSQGKYKEAEPIIRRALEGREKVLGPEHPYTLISVSNLGVVLMMQEKYEEAEEMQRRDLEASIKTLGLEHPDTFASLHHVAMALEKQSRYEEAEKLGRQAVTGCEKVLGLSHADTLRCISHLALILERQEKNNEAEVMYRRVLEGRKQVFGPTHQYTLESVAELESFLEKRAKCEKSSVTT